MTPPHVLFRKSLMNTFQSHYTTCKKIRIENAFVVMKRGLNVVRRLFVQPMSTLNKKQVKSLYVVHRWFGSFNPKSTFKKYLGKKGK